METQFQQNSRIIHDFTATTLAAIPSVFARLVYLASLRDLSSGRYEHEGLRDLYPDEAIQQAVAACHEELFERLLETPLMLQAKDLRECLEGMPGGLRAAVAHWRRMESYRWLMPECAAGYLKELFCSNLAALLEILAAEYSTARSTG
jgi:hypothetical protein